MYSNCLQCGDALIGRIDKKFCDDGCRSSYHNQHNRKTNRRIRTIQKSLKRNRQILAYFYEAGKGKYVPKEALVEHGFSFDLHTRLIKSDDEMLIVYSYDLGVTEVKTDLFEIVINQDDFKAFSIQ